MATIAPYGSHPITESGDMDIIGDLAAHFAAGYPAFDPSAVSRVATALAEPVLLSGPVLSPGQVAALADKQSHLFLASCVACIAAIAFALPVALRLTKVTLRLPLSLVAVSVVVVAVVTAALSAANGWYASYATPRGYVLTTNRIVLVEANGSRTDYPTSTVTSVQRTAGGGVEITTARGPGLAIHPGSTDSASLDTAYEALTGAFRPNPIVRDSVVR